MSVLALCSGNAEDGSGSHTPLFQRFSCGVGHVMNDFARQLLISFRLVFFMKVLGLSAANAGWLMLYGVLIVAAMMPVSAYLIDKISIPFLSRKFGRKKSWHFTATLVAAIVIPLYYSSCLPCQSSGEQWQLMLYIAMLNTCLAFAVGTLEIGHLSIIPDIAKTQSEAVELNVWRTTFTFLSGITTYVVAWAVLGQNTSDQVSAESAMDFTVTTLILVGIGLLCTLIFHWGTIEPRPGELEKTTSAPAGEGDQRKNSYGVASIGVDNKALDHDDAEFCSEDGNDDKNISSRHGTLGSSETNSGSSSSTVTRNKVPAVSFPDPEAGLSEKSKPKTIRVWLKDPHFYKVTLIFTCTKVLEALSFSYLPFYLIYRMKFEKDAIAYLPMIMLVSATLSSGISKKLIKIIGSESCFIVAAFVVIGSGVWFNLITQSYSVMVYPAVVLLGFGFSTMLVNSLSFAAELIGDNKSTSGFVFGFMGLMSRLMRAALITTIQKLFPEERGCEECGEYVRFVFSFVPGALAATCLLILIFFQVCQSICQRKDPQRATKEENNGVENTRC